MPSNNIVRQKMMLPMQKEDAPRKAHSGEQRQMKMTILLLLLTGYLVLNQGFMQIRAPFSDGIPIGEFVLLCWLATINIWSVLARMSAIINLTPFVIWWGYCIGRATVDAADNGIWALRDASQVIDSFFLIVGFNLVRRSYDLEPLFRWLPRLLAFSAIYVAIGYPLKIAELSPTLSGGSGQPVPLIGIMNTADVLLLWGAMYLLIAAPKDGIPLRSFVAAGALVSYAVLFLQNRTIYLQLAAMLVVMAIFRRRAVGQILAFVPVIVACVVLISTLGLTIPGRLSDKISLAFFADHVAAIFGISQGKYEAIAEAASGVDERLQWWSNLYDQVTADPITLLTGLGYGFPLIPFTAVGGIQVREPHNSIISVFARSGMIGLLAWIWLQGELFRCWAKSFRRFQRAADGEQWQNRLLVLLSLLVLILVGIAGEDNMEKPFFAIPYYCFWGIILKISFLQKPASVVGWALPKVPSYPLPFSHR